MKRVGGIRTFESGLHIIIPSIRRSDEWKAEGRIDPPDFDQLQRGIVQQEFDGELRYRADRDGGYDEGCAAQAGRTGGGWGEEWSLRHVELQWKKACEDDNAKVRLVVEGEGRVQSGSRGRFVEGRNFESVTSAVCSGTREKRACVLVLEKSRLRSLRERLSAARSLHIAHQRAATYAWSTSNPTSSYHHSFP